MKIIDDETSNLISKIDTSLNEANLRLEELYLRIINLEDIIEDMHSEQCDRIRIPHRCPACNGCTMDFDGAACLPCDGKGIIWG